MSHPAKKLVDSACLAGRHLEVTLSAMNRTSGNFFRNMIRERRLMICFLLLIAMLYVNSLPGDYVFDDTFLVRDNPYIESIPNFISYFTEGSKELGGRPVRLTSFFLDTLVFGKNLYGYHASNIFYYAVYCLLIFFFSRRLLGQDFVAIAATLLFITHPLHTEGVAYISGRKDILGGLFSIASLIGYDRYIHSRRLKDALLTLLFFLLAIAAKEIYAILPLLYLGLNIYRKVPLREQKTFCFSLGGFGLVFVLYVMFVRNTIFFDYLHTIPVYGGNQGVNFATGVKICAIILQKAFLPFNLSADYTFNAVKRINFSDPAFFVSFFVVLIPVLGAFIYRRKGIIFFGLMWLAVLLLPVCQLVPYPEILSERSLILLSFGTCLVIAHLIGHLPRRWSVGCLLIVLTIFSVTTIKRNLDWRNDMTLWQSAVEAQPDCARARYNLGIAFAGNKQLDAAEKAFLASLALNPPELVTVPDYSLDALVNLGNTYALRGDLVGAETVYRRVLHYDDANRLALQNLQIVLNMQRKENQKKKAIKTLRVKEQ
jgi:tetratricopeptide (TPR) repeat protein